MESGNSRNVPEIALTEVDGEPRARDVDIAERLGFAQPRQIRELVKRNLAEIEGFGLASCRTTSIESGKGRTMEVREYWLNEEQALLVSVLSKAPNAPAVRAMLIRVFVAWRRGKLAPASAPTLDELATVRIATAVFKAGIETLVPEIVRAELARGIATRHGQSAGRIWRESGFPPIKGIAVWFGNRLEAMGCAVENGFRGESGTGTFRVFDPDKARRWLNNGGRFVVEQRVAERHGQGKLHLVGKAK